MSITEAKQALKELPANAPDSEKEALEKDLYSAIINKKGKPMKHYIYITKSNGTNVATLEFDAEESRDYLINNLIIKTARGYIIQKGETNATKNKPDQIKNRQS